ncbi:MAG TPA: hypothetical protein VJ928_03445 [Marivita sp.]|nr:hypothetical protein [Marivita sp.]
MKAMILGFVAIAIIAVSGDLILEQMGWSAAEQGVSPSNVRLD